jgi:hypothetical protein
MRKVDLPGIRIHAIDSALSFMRFAFGAVDRPTRQYQKRECGNGCSDSFHHHLLCQVE